MKGRATYEGYELRYALTVNGRAAQGTLSFESQSAPIHQWAETDANPNAAERVLTLDNGQTLHFRVIGTSITPTIVHAGQAIVESTVTVIGHLD